MPIYKDVIKNREIRFTRSMADPANDQASKAMKLLADVDGIEAMSVTTFNTLRIRYDVQKLTLQMLESALIEVGFGLNNSFIMRIKRGLFAYCEEAQRSGLGIEQAKTESPSLTLSEHVARDPRPDNWRNYV
jgi:hypothetical protein